MNSDQSGFLLHLQLLCTESLSSSSRCCTTSPTSVPTTPSDTTSPDLLLPDEDITTMGHHEHTWSYQHSTAGVTTTASANCPWSESLERWILHLWTLLLLLDLQQFSWSALEPFPRPRSSKASIYHLKDLVYYTPEQSELWSTCRHLKRNSSNCRSVGFAGKCFKMSSVRTLCVLQCCVMESDIHFQKAALQNCLPWNGYEHAAGCLERCFLLV